MGIAVLGVVRPVLLRGDRLIILICASSISAKTPVFRQGALWSSQADDGDSGLRQRHIHRWNLVTFAAK